MEQSNQPGDGAVDVVHLHCNYTGNYRVALASTIAADESGGARAADLHEYAFYFFESVPPVGDVVLALLLLVRLRLLHSIHLDRRHLPHHLVCHRPILQHERAQGRPVTNLNYLINGAVPIWLAYSYLQDASNDNNRD